MSQIYVWTGDVFLYFFMSDVFCLLLYVSFILFTYLLVTSRKWQNQTGNDD